jgi:pimeloyl-ACP methyl ester carboxylesterase
MAAVSPSASRAPAASPPFRNAHTLLEPLRKWLGDESINTLREALLCSFDLAPIVPSCGEADDVVVLVHGFMATAGCFRPLKRRIEAETRARVASFSHVPGASVHAIALRLATLVSALPTGARIHLVGHSLGGLVARYYVQELGGHARAVQTISLGTPFGGAKSAARFPYFVGRDLAPGAPLLERLKARASTCTVPHTSIVGTADRTLGEASRGRFVTGESFELEGRGHNSLLFDDDATELVLARIRAHAVASRSKQAFPEPDARASHVRPCDAASPPLSRSPC